MISEEKSNSFLILVSIGILIGAGIVYWQMKKQQILLQAQIQTAQMAYNQQMHDIEHLRDTIKIQGEKAEIMQAQEQKSPIETSLKLLQRPPEWSHTKTEIKHEESKPCDVKPKAEAEKQAVQKLSNPMRDIEFIKWYTDTIVKPSIETVARESAEKAISQFMATKSPATRVKSVMIQRNVDGFIERQIPIKRTQLPQNKYNPTKHNNDIIWQKKNPVDLD